MLWQDIVIGIAVIFFNIALLPSLKSKHKPALQTSLMTGTLLIVVGLTQLTLNLYFSGLFTLINGALWLTLAYQKYTQKDD